jgi:hypothetical protein
MLLITTLIVVLWLNYLTDYMLQTKKMSENKHNSVLWLLAHVSSFTLALGILVSVYNIFANAFTWGNLVLLILLNGLTHFIIDYISSKITAYYYKNNKLKQFIRVIGGDQTLHVTIIVLLTYYFIN